MNLNCNDTNLSNAEKKLLNKLLAKLRPEKPKKDKMAKPTFCHAKTYLKLTNRCLLCKTVTIDYAVMVDGSMVAMQSDAPEEWADGAGAVMHSCPCCVQKLMDLDKAKLVGLTIQIQGKRYTENLRRN